MATTLFIDAQNLLVSMALITPRSYICLAILPCFGSRTLVGITRNAVAMAIALPALLPTYAFVQEFQPGYMLAGALAFKEAAIGGLLGVLLAMPMWVTQSIGSILDAQRSPIQIQSNSDPDASATGALLMQAVVVLMIQAGLLVSLVRVLIDSYGLWPAFSLMPPFETGHMGVLMQRFGEFFWHIVVYGGPVIIPLLLIDFGFAIIGIFASGLQVSFVSSPVKSLAGLFILLVYWATLSHYVSGDFAHMLDLAALLLQAGGQQ
ncbi:Type III secretion inner membrane protein (YscT,HrcT,SpaR,EscT,EpaR1,homologous to flagellar export components) [Collimonas arenae]|uniref:Type III secretion inner membrane protein (YscT,HrcT,SpaR,EscT,EpaR1,homologous to flagellar export components) n=1 Tax=Collimonas arenae TaxID=279058 RepID=A0A0A1F7A4_9BURK|nr:type III secretion system export apparatus subunit SctT [Collimonas arenae]AIY39675.1 Type III secretion inner membrane protein (YscT,HrcT,SpaR,EscT,EpaR1,homologous to flagellar export components) [Collimonas arenae]